MESTDEQLLSLIAKGDSKAFASFYDRHATTLFSAAATILGAGNNVETVFEEAIAGLWTQAAEFDPAFGRPLSWALTRVRRHAVDRRSKTSPGEATADDTARSADGGEAVNLNAEVRMAFLALPEEPRTAIELAFHKGLTGSEIAARMRRPPGAIKAAVRAGLLQLGAELKARL